MLLIFIPIRSSTLQSSLIIHIRFQQIYCGNVKIRQEPVPRVIVEIDWVLTHNLRQLRSLYFHEVTHVLIYSAVHILEKFKITWPLLADHVDVHNL